MFRPRSLPRLSAAIVALALLAATLPAAMAQDDVRFFPETGRSLRGSFRSFWEANGATAIFGYPISDEFAGPGGRATQWFERARFELGESAGQAQVSLASLGVEATGGRAFPKVPPIEDSADRRYIAETQHIIQYGFKQIWESRGDARIFGYPISEEIDEVLDDGEWHTVQYFERFRFEYWPDLPPGQRVLLSLLGRKLAPAQQTAPAQPAPPSQPAPPPALPASVNATVTPDRGPPGTSFAFAAAGFDPGEPVGVWLTAPDQSTFGADFQATADDQGSIAGANIAITTDSSFAAGVWSFNAQGVRSGRQAIGYFLIGAVSAAGDPGKLGQVAHDQLPRQGQAIILPVAAPSGTPFFLVGAGFSAGEEVSAWVTGPDGTSAPVDGSQVQADGTSVQVTIDTSGLPEGVYTAVAQGRGSGVLAAAAFKLTRDYVAGPGTPRPANVASSATPAEGPVGTVFQIRGQGLQPGEQLELWITYPSGLYVLFPELDQADSAGRVGYDPPVDLQATGQASPGVYGIHYRGVSSGARVDAYFTVVGSAKSAPGGGDDAWVQRQLGGPLFGR